MELLAGIIIGAAFSKFWIAGWEWIKASFPVKPKE